MRSFVFGTCLLVAALAFMACDELPPTEPLPEAGFRLNLPVGRTWIYTDSLQTLGRQTSLAVRSVVVSAAGIDNLSTELRGLLHLRIVTLDLDSANYAEVWYRHSSEGLWEVAYRNGDNVFAYPRLQQGVQSEPVAIWLRLSVSDHQLGFWVGEPPGTLPVIVRSEPRLVMKYPMQPGLEWLSFQQPFRRTLKCVRAFSMQVLAGTFEVFELEGRGTADPVQDFWLRDYFCSEGLVRREINWHGLRAFSASGQQLLDPVDVTESITLISMAQ